MKNLIIATIIVCAMYLIWIFAIAPMVQDVVNTVQPRVDNFNMIIEQLNN